MEKNIIELELTDLIMELEEKLGCSNKELKRYIYLYKEYISQGGRVGFYKWLKNKGIKNHS